MCENIWSEDMWAERNNGLQYRALREAQILTKKYDKKTCIKIDNIQKASISEKEYPKTSKHFQQPLWALIFFWLAKAWKKTEKQPLWFPCSSSSSASSWSSLQTNVPLITLPNLTTADSPTNHSFHVRHVNLMWHFNVKFHSGAVFFLRTPL